ncbi:hypothetical protein HanIR_Chr17g0895191 [Helianthus annuus]|nr:hypothetical protein HanIR_Chr17g0895191 [Helianthus annuus]
MLFYDVIHAPFAMLHLLFLVSLEAVSLFLWIKARFAYFSPPDPTHSSTICGIHWVRLLYILREK